MRTSKPYIEHLFEDTGELLYRVRKYDRQAVNRDEIMKMDENYKIIKNSNWIWGSELLKERAVDKLQQMKLRLVTMMENLLYSA